MASISVKLDHIRLDVHDIDVSERFYCDALDFQRVVRYEVGKRIILQMAPDSVPPGVGDFGSPLHAPRGRSDSRAACGGSHRVGGAARSRCQGWTATVLNSQFAPRYHPHHPPNQGFEASSGQTRTVRPFAR